MQGFFNLVRIGEGAGDHRDRVDPLGVDDHDPVLLQKRNPSCRFQLFKGNDHIGSPLGNDGRVHLFAVAHIGYHASAALAHAVHFGNLHVISRSDHHMAKQSAGKQGSLPADTYKHYVFHSHYFILPLTLRRQSRRICTVFRKDPTLRKGSR
ncbi:hypothetical protein SDC9_181647 [bioreactor metagenome]|uniref:Uncharacterized protein n=1 Tax=bioreactor metagenome TaxID=1076179 RepID=A0A645HDI2_9ZZZZ